MNTRSESKRKKIDSTEIQSDFLDGLLNNMADGSPLPLVGTEGPDHMVRYVNPAFCRISGQTALQLLGHPLAIAVSEGEAHGRAALLDRVYLTGTTEALADQIHTSSEPRSEAYWSYTAWVVLDGSGRHRGVMVQVVDATLTGALHKRARDISEAITLFAMRQLEQTEQAETGKKRLHQAMRESDHRMKNHLQSVCALLDIQTMENEVTVPVGELVHIRTHIRTLALIHDLLTKDTKSEEGPSCLSVQGVLRQLMPMLQEVVGATAIIWHADETVLPTSQGISVAIIVNELVTNAVKHGGINIEMTAAATGRIMTLVICDDGPGFPDDFDPRVNANFGLELLESMCRIELRGEIRFENRQQGGACVVIDFPLATDSSPRAS